MGMNNSGQSASDDYSSALWAWQRNVIPEFKDKTTEEIKAVLKTRQFPFAVLFENFLHDFNTGTGMRNANAFGASAIYYIGKKRFDKRGLCGVHNYSTIEHLKSIEELKEKTAGHTLIGVDNIEGAVPIDDFVYPPNPVFVFGTEVGGLTKEMIAECKTLIYLEQFGSVPSINCGSASAIVMHDFVSKYRRLNGSK